MPRPVWVMSSLLILLAASPAEGTFHFMQIEQVVGGVDGDYSAQAIQLRMRSAGQEQVQLTRLVAWDANGENPIVLLDLTHPVTVSQTGARILVATESFGRYTQPQAVPDFLLTESFPPSYITAGSLTFETDAGDFVVWRFSWGGDGYRGTTRGGQSNDDDGDFGPPFAGSLPGDGLTALHIQLSAEATGTGSADDFLETDSAALFVNNGGQAFVLTAFACPDETAGEDADDDGVGSVCDQCPDDPDKLHAGRCGCAVADADSDADGLPDCAAIPPPSVSNGDDDELVDEPVMDDDHDHDHGEEPPADGNSEDEESPAVDPDAPAIGTIGQVTYGAFCGTVSMWMWGLLAFTLFATARRRHSVRGVTML